MSDTTWAAKCALTSDNRSMFHVWLTYQPNPLATPSVESRPEGVFVFLADIDDLAVWFETAGGLVEKGPVFAGMRPWTLTVDTGSDFRDLIVHVSVLAMTDAQIMHTLTDAARLTAPQAVSA